MDENLAGCPDLGNVIEEIDKSYVDAIYLFGSWASGRAKPMSDIDVCVIAKKDIPKEAKEAILSNSSRKIDIVFFYDLPYAIRFRVLKEGNPLYVKDALTVQRIKAETLKYYLDFRPVIKRHISRTLGE
jgi:Nucleotidyltransferase domain.